MLRQLILAAVLSFAIPNSGIAQQADPLDEMKTLLDQAASEKKEIVQKNMNLSEAEAQAFWPIYEAFQEDLRGINHRMLDLIASYADAYSSQTLSDEKAKQLLTEMLDIEADEIAMRRRYASELEEALSGRTAVRYLQIENKIRAAGRFGLASKIPLAK